MRVRQNDGVSFSDPTLGLLVDLASELSTSSLDTLFLRADLRRFRPSSGSKAFLLHRVLTTAKDAADEGDDDAQRALLSFVPHLLPRLLGHPAAISKVPVWFDTLREALLADGYELVWDSEPTRTPIYRILPTDAPAAPLAGSVSALEDELADLGYDIARNHYKQATENHIQHNFESSNSQLRAMMEDLLVRLAQQHCNYSGPPKGGMALNHMVDRGHLPADGEGKLIQGLWKMLHTNGSHPGKSNADEARFRLQTVTAVARLLISHFRTS
jgi:hypothetical protein